MFSVVSVSLSSGVGAVPTWLQLSPVLFCSLENPPSPHHTWTPSSPNRNPRDMFKPVHLNPTIGRSKGRGSQGRTPSGPISFIFIQFSKISNNRLWPKLRGWRLPLENLGSTTARHTGPLPPTSDWHSTKRPSCHFNVLVEKVSCAKAVNLSAFNNLTARPWSNLHVIGWFPIPQLIRPGWLASGSLSLITQSLHHFWNKNLSPFTPRTDFDVFKGWLRAQVWQGWIQDSLLRGNTNQW